MQRAQQVETTTPAVGRTFGPGRSVSGLEFERYFSKDGVDPFDEIEWELRSAVIANERGELVFEQRDVEFPKFWSQQATNIVVSKYFRGQIGTPQRERSVRQLIGRVVDTITNWAREQEYFASEDDLQAFSDDLKHLLVYQKGSFNSPVWFNCGFEKAPQCSACFINSVQDTMESILTLAKTEGMLFKFGSGTGSNLSSIRSSQEILAGGGTASGPVSFMKGFDAFAGVIKSGGKTRRAAKMVILNAEHPDIVEFINCKVEEEKKAWALIDAGYDGSFTGPAYASVFFQNSNNSVRVTDEFMRAVLDDGEWETRGVTSGEVMGTYKARDLMHQIADATWVCGDPGMQFDTTVNDWHTCPNTARINASNPCSEYMFLDDSACNLASINLMKFVREDGELDPQAFAKACETFITAQEILVDNASYPTKAIERNSHDYRPLGLGYANLGALLMSRGLPYDSDAGRDYAATITAVMHGAAYAQSSRVARDHGGPFPGYEKNREPMLRVMRKHRAALRDINRTNVPKDLFEAAKAIWDECVELGEQHGYRNAQATVLAPTGTIGFMMDCDTTGVEPDIALVKYKKLVGGGIMKIVNNTVPMALSKLGYTAAQIKEIVAYIDEHETIEGAPHLKDKDLAVFDCAFKPAQGARSIHYMGHIKMMGAVQPFISGAISKTVNVPKAATVEEIEQAYIDAWRIGAKAVSIYRDGSKRTQPLNTSKDKQAAASSAEAAGPRRRRLPDERASITHKFDIAGHEGYITVGLYEDGQPGELFLTMAKEGSTISGFADAFAQAISYALQYGVPLQDLVDKFSHARFEPSGMTKNPDIRFAKSIVDYIFRWLAAKFLSPEAQYRAGVNNREEVTTPEQLVLDVQNAASTFAAQSAATVDKSAASARSKFAAIQNQEDAPPCSTCGSIMVRSGACYKCSNCGTTSGCA
ncbi:MAG TPA: vitamin B12-dependent ribonucleotide reductase [Vicinamibacterales bacterium]|jgi:ribonucleoside-diphosphate reductase alpha chain|nr:vitamin B12-dependent ribonucleotide reductase [Vicinamibacterales bacterium]